MTYLSETAHPAVLKCTLTQWTDYYSTSLHFYSVAVLVILFNTKLSIVVLQALKNVICKMCGVTVTTNKAIPRY